MKKLFIALICLTAAEVSAQTVVSEEFDGSTHLDWQEYADKTGSALAQNGYFELKPLSKETVVMTRAMLPIDVEGDFKVCCTVFLPHMGDDNKFGIFFDMDDSFNKTLMLFAKERVSCVKRLCLKGMNSASSSMENATAAWNSNCAAKAARLS